MIERRAEGRTRTQLCVDISGSDAHCGDFRETVFATNLSLSGALLTNVHAELRCGDLLAVEYSGRHASFRIVWVLACGENEGWQIAVQRLTTQLCPWENMLAAESPLSLKDH